MVWVGEQEDFKDVDGKKLDPATSGRELWPQAKEEDSVGGKNWFHDLVGVFSRKNSEGEIYSAGSIKVSRDLLKDSFRESTRIRPAAAMFCQEMSKNRQGFLQLPK